MENPNVILTEEQLHEAVEYFKQYDEFVWDIESMGENRGVPSRNRVVWISMATYGRSIVIPFGHPNGNQLISRATKKLNRQTKKFDMIPAVYDDPPEQLLPSTVFDALRPLLFSDRIKIAHSATMDVCSLTKYYNERIPAPIRDTIVLQWLLDENMIKYGLKLLTEKYYKVKYDHEEVGKCIEAHPFDKVAHYSYMDAKYTWLLYRRLVDKIGTDELDRVFAVENDVTDVLCSMKDFGIDLDVPLLKQADIEFAEITEIAEAKIYKAAGKEFNINSTPQKQHILFGPKDEGGQGLIPKKMTKTGFPSTDSAALERFASNPVVAALENYQEASKLHGYVRSYLNKDPKKPPVMFDGRVYADFVQYGTVTGRSSCRNPNLQNIPRPDTELGKKIRSLFIPPPNNKFIVADYGQVELVILAHFSKDKNLLEGFRNGIDAHTSTASVVFGVAHEQVTKPMRTVAKAIAFATVYGAGPEKVAAMAGVTVTEAKKFLGIHRNQFGSIYTFKKNVVAVCRQRKPHYVKTLLGRKRRLPNINSAEDAKRGYSERQAVNSVVQGSSADITKIAMVKLHNSLPEDMHLILSVHDELVTSVPNDPERIALGEKLVREAMVGDWIDDFLVVRPTLDLKIVDRWADAK